MLQITDIRKKYTTGDLVQTALDGVSLNLRDNEFVAILGPSGSGKTTLLNVIGGLDRYDSGDLIINGISTKEYTDRDWDSYRNHTIGFIFQSYNLIPHQTVLANVELALTISGISRRERRRRAKKALEDVGLGSQLHKKPNQMSGGQMQRVAIARALVNNPDILLADEPTGALDSDTSVQVMELLKEVSRDRLVVMVTHNPELAEEYANRIVRLRDGRITDDTNPYEVNCEAMAPPQHKNMGRSSMSVFTSLALSFNNLWTKKARTLLTSFAGSIGIIGIALIMALSTGFQNYIDKIQEDTLSTYPLTIQSETADMTAAMAAFGTALAAAEDVEPGVVREQQMISQVFAQIGSNDLGAFKAHLDGSMTEIGDTINALKYGYSVSPRIYAADTSDGVLQVNPASLFGDLTGNPMMSAYMDSNIFYEMIDNIDLLDSQYEMLQGRWPESSTEMVMVLSNPGSISDYMAYTIGLRDPDELSGMVQQIMSGQEAENIAEPMEWSYDQLMALTFRMVAPSDTYVYNEEFMVWEDMSGNEEHMRSLVDSGEELTIVGIVCPREGVSASALTPGIAYTSQLTHHIIDIAADSQIVTAQLSNSDVDVFTGQVFGAENEGSALDFQEMISVDTDLLSSSFNINLSEEFLTKKMEEYMEELSGSMTGSAEQAQADFIDGLRSLATGMLTDYVAANADPSTGKATLKLTDAESIVTDYLATDEAVSLIAALETKYSMPYDSLTQVYNPLLMGLITTLAASALPELPDISTSSSDIFPPVELPSSSDVFPPIEIPSSSDIFPPIEIPSSSDIVFPPLFSGTASPSDAGTSGNAGDGPAEDTASAGGVSAADAPTMSLSGRLISFLRSLLVSSASGSDIELPDAELPDIELPDIELPDVELPEIELPETSSSDVVIPGLDSIIDTDLLVVTITAADIEPAVEDYVTSTVVTGTSAAMSMTMSEAIMQEQLTGKVTKFSYDLIYSIAGSFNVDAEKIASAFNFELDEEELARLMEAFSTSGSERSADSNLRSLGYADRSQPSYISIYLVDFTAKERFLAFIDSYNEEMESSGREELVISYTDMTGVLMSSVKTIVDSVSYVLIAFVAVSLIVSSIMIGIITYISVLERTKEIGVLRAIGASKKNISQVFNAETFIIGLCSGLIGVGVTLSLLPLINSIIHALVESADIRAQLPVTNAVVLVVLSMILTIIGGLIPSKKAATKDPVIALRSE